MLLKKQVIILNHINLQKKKFHIFCGIAKCDLEKRLQLTN